MQGALITLLLGGCAWVTPAELDDFRAGCACAEGEPTYYPDRDGDGWGWAGGNIRCLPHDGWVEQVGDCDDENPDVHPEAEEVCDDVDDDCDGETDERGATGEVRWFQDADGDGWGDATAWQTACAPPSGYVGEAQTGDCDDDDASIHPEAEEVCSDLTDNNCDGEASECRLEGSLTLAWADLFVEQTTPMELLGVSLAAGADLHGSAHLDVVLGAWGWEDGGNVTGAVLVFPGPFGEHSTLESVEATAILLGSSLESPAGRSLALLTNQSGLGDTRLAVGCAPWEPGSDEAGAVYVIETIPVGTTSIQGSSPAALDDAAAGAVFGHAMDGGADVDGDGRSDLLVGAPGTAGLTGEARLFVGPVSVWGGIGQARAVFAGPADGAQAGFDVALCPDVDGDGLADALVGAPEYADRGGVALYLSPTGDMSWSAADARYQGTTDGDRLGTVAAAGDTDADGYGDYLLGAPGYGGRGRVWLLLGSSCPWLSLEGAEATVTGLDPGDGLGWDLAPAGDFDADGYADIALGAPGVDDSGAEAGRALLLYGPVTGALQADDAPFIMRGLGQDANAGLALATAGDLDEDGFGDLLVGAPGVGQVALFRGQGW
ncbi:MAG: MopE-related protein [Pseudomonadota bacterium]